MNEKTFKFQNIRINKKEFHKSKQPEDLASVNVDQIVGTDAKALVSVHALAALNIHFGGNKWISQRVLGEYFKNLSYQALSQENDKIILSFSEIVLLVND